MLFDAAEGRAVRFAHQTDRNTVSNYMTRKEKRAAIRPRPPISAPCDADGRPQA
jgi:hypothetical protein